MGADTEMYQELQAVFDEISVDLDALGLLKPCADLCVKFHKKPQDLALEWEAFATSKSVKGVKMTGALLDEFSSKHLKAVATKEAMKKKQFSKAHRTHASTFTKDTLSVLGDSRKRGRENDGGDDAFGTPAPGLPSASKGAKGPGGGAASPLDKGPSPQYVQRQDPGKVEATMNGDLGLGPSLAREGDAGADGEDSDVQVDAGIWNASEPMPCHMWDRLEDRAASLDRRAEALGGEICATEGLEDPVSVLRATVEVATAVGRVVCDSEGKLNASSVFLETTRKSSSGMRVKLDLTQVPEFALFPGQVVAVQGSNPRGSAVQVEALYAGVPRAPPAPRGPDQGLRAVFAAGPFTTDDSLSFEPLDDLLRAAGEACAQAVVLFGPFLPDCHPLLVDPSGAAKDAGDTFERVFKRQVVDRVHAWLADQRAAGRAAPKVIMVPSTADVHVHPTLPQSPLDVTGTVEPKRDPAVIAVRNPSVVSVGGYTMALCSADIIKALAAEECFRVTGPPSQREDRMARLCRHVLEQRLFVPNYPPPKGLCVDTGLAMEHALLPETPHVLAIPSELNKFAKPSRGTVCINPGRLVKRTNGGTYAVMQIHAPPPRPAEEIAPPTPPAAPECAPAAAEPPTPAAGAAGVAHRTCVQLVRI